MRVVSTLVRLFVIAVALLGPSVGQAYTQERITRFVSDVVIDTEGAATVTETIQVVAQGREIRRGIIREIPFVLQGAGGARVASNYEVLSVTRNGNDEPFSVEADLHRFTIQIGDPNQLLTPGQHEYIIRYKMSRIARSFKEHDEIYWNATGNEWVFAIDHAEAFITLPQGAKVLDSIAYSGANGSTKRDVTLRQTSANTVKFTMQHRLNPLEGMTVAVSFNKGAVIFPRGLHAGWNWILDRLALLGSLLLSAVTVLFTGYAWFHVGRDPKPGIIIPRYFPPKDMSPATVSYIANQGKVKSTGFTAGLFNLGVKQLVMMENDPELKALSVIRTTSPVPGSLPEEESLLLSAIEIDQPLIFKSRSESKIGELASRFNKSVAQNNMRRWFKPNMGYVVAAVILFVLQVVWVVINYETAVIWVAPMAFAGFFLFGIGSFLKHKLGAKFRNFVLVCIAGIVLAGLYASGPMVLDWVHIIDPVVFPVIVTIFAMVIFVPLMSVITPEGRAVLDEIEGFQMYLDTAEKHRLNMEYEPELTMTRFEAMLPYAIALGLEKQWSKKFETVLQQATDEQGRINSSFGLVSIRDTHSVVNLTNRSVQSSMAQLNSSSSSGFSGGSSGGGSGGGGGRGW